MADPVITCPHCKREIKLNETLAAPLVEGVKRQFEEQARQREQEIAKREEALVKAKGDLEAQLEERIKAERDAIAEREKKRAQEAAALSLRDLEEQLSAKSKLLDEAQKIEIDLRNQRRALEEEKKSLELQKQRELDAERAKIHEQAKRESMEEIRLSIAEKDKKISDMARQVEEFKRRLEQGSQQLQGEVQELDLEALLSSNFPKDAIERVPKGQHGGDVIQRVRASVGQACGTILWESKRTKAWSDGWLPKLRDDQRAAQAEFAVLVSATLPKEVETFGYVDGVWVTNTACALPVTVALREMLIRVAATQRAGEGQRGKMELIYDYLCGPQFRHRVEAIVEGFVTMRDDLESEKRAIQKHWAKREKQIERVLTSTTGLYGDLQGIAGRSLPEIESLEMKSIKED